MYNIYLYDLACDMFYHLIGNNLLIDLHMYVPDFSHFNVNIYTYTYCSIESERTILLKAKVHCIKTIIKNNCLRLTIFNNFVIRNQILMNFYHYGLPSR